MPQISCDKNVEINNKTTRDRELAKNNKKHSHVTLTPRVTHAPLAGYAKTIYLAAPVTPSSVTTKQARAAMTTMKTKTTIFIF